MGRPKAVVYKNFKTYDKLHTEPTKMFSGIKFNTLYPIRETKFYYVSCEVWAYCASKFKRKKKFLKELEVNIDILTDEKAVEFLEKNCWNDKELYRDEEEASEFLKKLYPNHKFKYFYELDNLLGGFIQGSFVRYDKDGNEETPNERDIEQRAYYTHKYHKMYALRKNVDLPEIKKLYDAYSNYREDKDNPNYDEKVKSDLFGKYYDAESKYVYENFDMTKTFRTIGEHGVCLPMAFSENTAEWSKEKYGKLIGYAHAGEVFFVVTEKNIYLNVKRHF